MSFRDGIYKYVTILDEVDDDDDDDDGGGGGGGGDMTSSRKLLRNIITFLLSFLHSLFASNPIILKERSSLLQIFQVWRPRR